MATVKTELSKLPKTNPQHKSHRLPYILLIGGIIALAASFILTLDKIHILSDPSYQPACNINPIISCGSVMKTDQASVFGFANSIIGIVVYSCAAFLGLAMLAGATFKRWFWLGIGAASLGSLAFVHWLIFESLYRIGSICPYCSAVWAVTAVMFWYTFLYLIENKHLRMPSALLGIKNFILRHHADILVSWYVIVIALILKRFWYYWSTLL